MKASLSCLARLSAVLSSGMTRSKMIKATFILAAALAAVPAMAETITFTISADGSGTLGGTPFTNQLITFAQVTDTTAIINPCFGFAYPCSPDVATNTVTIGGVGTETLTGPTYFFANQINLIGITNAPFFAFLAIEDNSLGSYNMQTSFGPTSFGIYGGSSVLGELTSGGLLSVNYAAGTQGTFEAVLGTPTATPEPASFFLMGTGLLAMGGILRRRIFRR
jgi:hypothetical protein